MSNKELLEIENSLKTVFNLKNKSYIRFIKAEIKRIGFENLKQKPKFRKLLKKSLFRLLKKSGMNNLSKELKKSYEQVTNISLLQLSEDVNIDFNNLELGTVEAIQNDFLIENIKQINTVNKETERKLRHLFTERVFRKLKNETALLDLVVENTKLGVARANTLITTNIASFDRTIMIEKAKIIGLKKFVYAGQKDRLNRPFCKARVRNTYTLKQAKQWDNGQGLNPLKYLGGYNCRHRIKFIPLD